MKITLRQWVVLALCLCAPGLALADSDEIIGFFLLTVIGYPIFIIGTGLLIPKGGKLAGIIFAAVCYPLVAISAFRAPVFQAMDSATPVTAFTLAASIGLLVYLFFQRKKAALAAFTSLFLLFAILVNILSILGQYGMMDDNQFITVKLPTLINTGFTALASLWWLVRFNAVTDKNTDWLTESSAAGYALQTVALVVAVKSGASYIYGALGLALYQLGIDFLYSFASIQLIGLLVGVFYLSVIFKQSREYLSQWLPFFIAAGVVFYAAITGLSFAISSANGTGSRADWHYLIPPANFLLTAVCAYGIFKWRTASSAVTAP